MRISLIFIRDKRFFSKPSSKFMELRKKHPYPGGKKHYVFGEPPLGIMYLSSVLKRAGHEVWLTDQCHPEYSDEKFLESLVKTGSDMVGISFLSTMCYPTARDLSRKIKTALPNVKIAYGGVFSTINADKIVASETSVDVVARGEGENIILDLASGMDYHDIAGITFRHEGKVVANPDRLGNTELDALPFPDRESLDINFVASLPLDVPAVIWDRPYTSIVSSRGCPFGCTYCNCPTFSHRRCRARSAANVLAELDEIKRLGYTSFTFLDDNFLLHPDRVIEIGEQMIARNYSFRWACEGRADPKIYGVLKTLAEAGCDLLMFGIESGSQRILDSLNKKTKIEEIKKSISVAKNAGIPILHGFFLVGCPGETVEEVKQTFLFAEKLPINSFAFNSLTAFRGTKLWNDAVSQGLIDDEKDWDKIFPVHKIFPNAIDSQKLFKVRYGLVKKLILGKILKNPLQAAKIFRRFLKCMSLRDLFRLLTSSKKTDTKR